MASTTDQLYGEKGKESLAKAVFRDPSRFVPGPGERAAKDLQRRQAAKEDPHSTLGELDIKSVSSKDLGGAIDKTIGGAWKTELDGSGNPKLDASGNHIRVKERVAGSDYQINFDAATAAAKFVQDFLKTRYSNMPEDVRMPVNRDQYRAKALAAVEVVWPDAKRAMAGMGPEARKKMMDRMLADPAFARHMQTKLQEIVDGAQEGKALPQEITDQLSRTKLDHDTKAKEAEWIESDRAAKALELEEEYGTTKKAGHRGDKLDKMPSTAALESDLAAADATLRKKNRDYADLERQLKAAQVAKDTSEVTRISGLMASKETEKEDAANAITEAKNQITLRKELEDYKTTLETSIRTLERDLTKKQIERDQAQNTYYLTLATKNEAEEDIKRAEKSFVSKLQNVEADAVREYLKDELGKYEETRSEIIKEHGDASLERGLQDRWNKKGKRNEFNRDTINGDYKIFINEGPDAVIRATLRASGMTDAEIDAKIATDHEFMEGARARVIDGLLTRRLLTGKINEGEARRIVDTPGCEQAIETALTARAKYDGTYEKLKEQGLLGGEFMRKLRALPHNRIVQILMLIFGLGGLFAVDALGGFGIASAAGAKLAAGAGHAANVGGAVVDKAAPFVSNAADKAGSAIHQGASYAGDKIGQGAHIAHLK